jgi:hypothetical protein
MKLIFISLFFITSLFSFDVNSKVQNLIGENNYKTYNKLLKKIFKKKHYTIEEVVYKLRNNGLLDIFFKSPKIIQTKFIFQNGNPIFNSKVLYDSLTSIGYYYFYPINIEKYDNYAVEIEFQSEHFIEPMSIIKEMKNRGCYLTNLNRNDEKFIYNFDCENIFIKEANTLKQTSKKYVYAKGVYWIKPNKLNKIRIYSKNLDFWHPYIVFYDKNLNIIKFIENENVKRVIVSNIPEDTEYIKIMDSFNKENIKRGIIVKGYK